jgi:5-formyltetrahydrofolate cyclo-ligase
MSQERSHRLKQAKRVLRREVLARRDALDPSDRAERGFRVTDRLLGLHELRGASTVLAYWSFGSEVDTQAAIRRLCDAGVRVALPTTRTGDLVAVAYRPGDPVTPAGFGAMEPSADDVVEPEAIDLVVVPGVAFDRRCARIGYGGGFYDRYLARTRVDAQAIAVAFALQLVEAVPQGRSDRRVDAIVTEDEVIRCPSG